MVHWLLNNTLWAVSKKTSVEGYPVAYGDDKESAVGFVKLRIEPVIYKRERPGN